MSEHRLFQGCHGDSGSRDQELWVQGQVSVEWKTASPEMRGVREHLGLGVTEQMSAGGPSWGGLAQLD